MKCRECGCYVEIKAEMKYNYNPLQGMKIELTHCPLAKWPDSDRKIVNYYRKEYGKAPLKK